MCTYDGPTCVSTVLCSTMNALPGTGTIGRWQHGTIQKSHGLLKIQDSRHLYRITVLGYEKILRLNLRLHCVPPLALVLLVPVLESYFATTRIHTTYTPCTMHQHTGIFIIIYNQQPQPINHHHHHQFSHL